MIDVINIDTSGILALEEIHKKLFSYGIEVRHQFNFIYLFIF